MCNWLSVRHCACAPQPPWCPRFVEARRFCGDRRRARKGVGPLMRRVQRPAGHPYVPKTYFPLRAQWAQCFIKKYRDFGIRVTSGTEASNNNVKSYLLNGMSHLYSLVEAIEAMLSDQERDFIDACAQDEVLTSGTYSGPGSEYLGELRTVISESGLRLITKQHRRALRSIPSRSRPWPEPIEECNGDCSVSWQLGLFPAAIQSTTS